MKDILLNQVYVKLLNINTVKVSHLQTIYIVQTTREVPDVHLVHGFFLEDLVLRNKWTEKSALEQRENIVV